MSLTSAVVATPQDALVRRVNQLYHELTQCSFDDDHRCRHRVERSFWRSVARRVLGRHTSPKTLTRKQDNPQGRVVVDLACGTGFVTQALGTRLGEADRLIAMDISEAALKTTAHKWAGGVVHSTADLQRLAGDGQALALADNSVDLLAINAALHHLPHPAVVLREIDRVLKPGGYFALGYEPNYHHFASATLANLSFGLARAGWYLSPRQNWRRLRERLQRKIKTKSNNSVRSGQTGNHITATINHRLIRDGLIAEPLSEGQLMDLVDPHARGTEKVAGFDPSTLLGEIMPEYAVDLLVCSDYLGPGLRRFPVIRYAADALFRAFLPMHGSLFCWLIRKPADGRPEDAACVG